LMLLELGGSLKHSTPTFSERPNQLILVYTSEKIESRIRVVVESNYE